MTDSTPKTTTSEAGCSQLMYSCDCKTMSPFFNQSQLPTLFIRMLSSLQLHISMCYGYDDNSPLFVPPAPDVGPGDDTTARYVGGGGGGGVVLLP